MPYALPQELVENIIDELASLQLPLGEVTTLLSREALISCTLVCRNWLPRSSHFLFRKLSISTHESCARFLSVLQGSSRLARYVRELSLKDLPDTQEGAGALDALMSTLPNVRYLHLCLLPLARDAPLRCLSVSKHTGRYTLDTLSLSQDARCRRPFLPSYLRLFGHVGHLPLSQTAGEVSGLAGETRFLRVGTVTVHSAHASVLRALGTLLEPSSLRKLVIVGERTLAQACIIASFNDFMCESGQEMEEIDLDLLLPGQGASMSIIANSACAHHCLRYAPDDQYPEQLPALSSCSKLRAIRLTVHSSVGIYLPLRPTSHV